MNIFRARTWAMRWFLKVWMGILICDIWTAHRWEYWVGIHVESAASGMHCHLGYVVHQLGRKTAWLQKWRPGMHGYRFWPFLPMERLPLPLSDLFSLWNRPGSGDKTLSTRNSTCNPPDISVRMLLVCCNCHNKRLLLLSDETLVEVLDYDLINYLLCNVANVNVCSQQSVLFDIRLYHTACATLTDLTLPYLTFKVGGIYMLPSAEAIRTCTRISSQWTIARQKASRQKAAAT